MALLIDGYNLLNVSGVFPAGRRGGTLEQARNALLDWLADSLTPDECTTTTIVFDARHAPPGLPRQFKHRGVQVQFAPRKIEADDLIEELIRASSSPRQLIVVSSDHRLQRAAKRRKATAVDSDVWCREIDQQRASVREETRAKPQHPPDDAEVARWVETFRVNEDVALDEALLPDLPHEAAAPATNNDEAKPTPAPDDVENLFPESELAIDEFSEDDISNPFPPGYGEDLLEDDDR